MKLTTYIEQIGDAEAAKRFGVKLRTVQSWRRGERRPRPTQIPAIIEGSDGKVTVSGIYGVDQAA